MGEVYRARDTKLGRSVAIKVLPEAVLFDADRAARFAREARTLASLNHPHIAALHGMEESGGRHFLVMELVEGETLADRLQRGPMPVQEALAVAGQIADALEAAHEKGIIHRDLKPANVKITPEDQVKVLDFGLAKALDSDPGSASIANSPTLSRLATEAGIILGTAAYMSPEQAKGFPADQRSDIFSFGAVLFEMLTGRRPFQGETAAEVLASVIVRDPDLAALPSALNPRIADLVRRCLEKHPKRRWQAIGDVRAEIEAILATPATISMPSVAAPREPLWRRAIPLVGVAVLGGVLTALGIWRSTPSPPPRAITRFSVALPDGHLIMATGRQVLALSPDGTQVAYAANGGVYLRAMSGLDVRPIQGVENSDGVTSVAFAPDGRSIVFWAADRTLKRIPVAGGAAITLCEAQNPLGLEWDRDGIVFGQAGGIMRISPNGGKPEVLVSAKGGELLFEPGTTHIPDAWSPDGKHLLFSIASGPSFTLSMLTPADRTSAPFGGVKSLARATPDFSPDGRWVAYSAAEQGVTGTQVYVQPFPPTGARYQLFAKGQDFPHHPLWTPDGKQLLYVPRVGDLEAVTVETEPTLVFGNAVRVPRSFPTAAPSTPRTFDITPSGKVIGVVVPAQTAPAGTQQRSIQVVLNWFEELKATAR